MFNKKGTLQDNIEQQQIEAEFSFLTYNKYEKQFAILQQRMAKAEAQTIIRGVVIKQKQQDSKLGFPTANILFKEALQEGVFISNINIGNTKYYAVSFVDTTHNILKSHILNFEKNIYGENITINMIKFLHNNVEYTNDNLKKQSILKDITEVYNFLSQDKHTKSLF